MAIILLSVLVGLAFGFTVISALVKKGWLAYAGAGVWMIATIQAFSISLVTWDVCFSLAFLFIALSLACMFSPLAWRETTSEGETPEDPDVAEMRAEMQELNRERSQFSSLHNNRRPRRRTRW